MFICVHINIRHTYLPCADSHTWPPWMSLPVCHCIQVFFVWPQAWTTSSWARWTRRAGVKSPRSTSSWPLRQRIRKVSTFWRTSSAEFRQLRGSPLNRFCSRLGCGWKQLVRKTNLFLNNINTSHKSKLINSGCRTPRTKCNLLI